MQNNLNSRTVKLAKMALMLAIAVICSLWNFFIIPAAPFLKFEISDIPILIAAFAFGPIPGLVVGVLSILIHDLMIGPESGPYGMIMHIIAVAVITLVAGFIYKKFKTRKGALVALIVGGLCMTAVMIPANLLVTPLFMGVPVEVVVTMLPTVIMPFNLLKVLIICVVVFFLYKRISPFLHKWGLEDRINPPKLAADDVEIDAGTSAKTLHEGSAVSEEQLKDSSLRSE